MDDSKDASADGSDTRPSNESEGNLAQQNHDTSESAISPPQSENSPEKSIIAEKFASEKSTRMSPRRPVTRSSIKRPIREENSLNSSTRSVHDSDPHAVEPTPASKKQKIAPATRTRNTRKSAATLESSMDSETPATNPISASSSHSPPPVAGSSSSTSLPDPPPPTTPSAAPPIATRIGTTRAMRATLPTPVPNLTKKSRGRRVPVRVITTTGAEIITNPAPVGSEPATDTSTGNGDVSKEKRSYVCSVEGCGKCFHRGEHLKRHIRSIHTHEKPFKCTYPECDKNFNRHDNLLQHLKVHKQAQATAAMTASRSSAVLLSNGKGKSKAKSKAKGQANSKDSSGKGKTKKKRRSSASEDEDEGESEAEEGDSAYSGSSDDDVDEASAVSNLLSLRANPPVKGSPTLIAPLHHNLTSSYHTLSSSGSSTATLIGSTSGWGYPTASSFSFSPNASSQPGSKPLYHPSFSSSFMTDSYPRKPYSSSSLPHSSFSLSKAYSSGSTTYESSAAAAATGGTDIDVLYNGHAHDMMSNMRNMRSPGLENSNMGMGMGMVIRRDNNSMNMGLGRDESEQLRMFQSNMAMSSLRSTSSALRSTNGQDPEKSVEGMDVDVGRSFSHPTGGDDVANSNGVEPSENEGDGSGQGRVSTTKDTHVDTTASGADVSLVFPPTTTTTTNPGTFANPDSLNAANPSDPTGASDSATTDKAAPAGQESTSGDSGLSFQQQQPSYTTQNVDQSMSSRLTLRPVEGEQNWRV